MSKGPAIAVTDHADAGSVQIASSAVVVGTVHLGERALVAEGAEIRSSGTGTAEPPIRSGTPITTTLRTG